MEIKSKLLGVNPEILRAQASPSWGSTRPELLCLPLGPVSLCSAAPVTCLAHPAFTSCPCPTG